MKKVMLIIGLVVAGILVPMNVWADDCLTELEILERKGELQRYAEDNILYYDGNYDGVEGCVTSEELDEHTEGGIECAMEGATNYAGEEILSAAMMAAVKENYPYYKAAADKYGIPWQALAAIHYRERRFSRASNPYQITGGGTSSDFGELTDEAAQFIKGKGSFESDDAAKRTFFRYNGTSSAYKQQALKLGFSEAEAENGEGSPYVMNKYDERRDPNKNGSNWGQIKNSGMVYPANQDFGAFVVYKALGNCKFVEGEGGAPEPGSYAEAIDQMAKQLAWPNRGNDIDNPKPEYLAALREYGYTNSSDTQVKRGSSCDVFVAVVLAKSGADPELVSRSLGAANQRSYLEQSSKWVEVPLNEARPGDIRTIRRVKADGSIGNHIEIVVSDGDSRKIASASNGDRTAEIGSYYTPSGTVKVFRRV